MGVHRTGRLLTTLLTALSLALMLSTAEATAEAKTSSGGSKSSSSGSHSSGSGSHSSSGLSKPSLGGGSSSSGSSSSSSSSSGLSKPSLGGSAPSSAPPATSSSSGLGKPPLGGAPAATAGQNKTTAQPGATTTVPNPFGGTAAGNGAGTPGPGGLTKPGLPASAGPAAAPSAASSAAPAAAMMSQKPAAASGLDAAASKSLSKSALSKFDAERNKFAAPPAAPADAAAVAHNPVWNRHRYNSADDYYSARERSWSNLHWQPPAMVYHSAPSFGMWDAMFLYLILDRVSQHHDDSARWAYSHADDPGYQAWHREVERSNDAEMKAKLAALDARVGALEAQKAPKDAAALPEGVDGSIALAPQAALSAAAMEAPAGHHGMGLMGWAIVLLLGAALIWAGYKMFGPRR